ncbi:MAG: hypothetical protein Fur0037_19880 [Planctomycetota bacterium]
MSVEILVDFQGAWGLGDLLCADPLIEGLWERHPGARILLRGKVGNLIHNPRVAGMADGFAKPDLVVPVRLFTHMDRDAYAELEALPSLVGHLCSYGGVDPRGRRPRAHLGPKERAVAASIPLKNGRAIAICADHLDPLRHWPVERWHLVARTLAGEGWQIVEVGTHDRLGVGLDLVGQIGVRETAAVLERCLLFLGNNSGLFHYAQAVDTPCVVLFSLAWPQRFVHEGAVVHCVTADDIPCLYCMTRCFSAMQRTGCRAEPRGRCMLEISVERVLEAAEAALKVLRMAGGGAALAPAGQLRPAGSQGEDPREIPGSSRVRPETAPAMRRSPW